MSSQSVAIGCVPSSISPSSWIPGFSDAYKKPKDFMCAMAGPDADAVKKLNDVCCKEKVITDDSGCYHYCKPNAENTVDWATCISDHVYTDVNFGFGYACNPPGELQLKNEKNAHDKAVAMADDDDDSGKKNKNKKRETSAAAPGFNVSWKVGVFVGFVGLVQAMC